MKKPILNEEIARLRKMMGLNENFEVPSINENNKFELNGKPVDVSDMGFYPYKQEAGTDYGVNNLFYADTDEELTPEECEMFKSKYKDYVKDELNAKADGDYQDMLDKRGEGIYETESLDEGENISGVYYDSTIIPELKMIVGNLHKIAPFVLEFGHRVYGDIDGGVSVYEERTLVKKFPSVEDFLTKIGYSAQKIESVDSLDEGTWEVNPEYTHFAISKNDGKIYNAWEYDSDTDRESIMYYCKMDLNDMDLNPKDFKVNSKKFLLGRGIDPFDSDNWKNTRMDEGDPEEKMVSFDDLISQEDQAMIDAHDEEQANKYTRNDDDIESGNI